MALAKLKWLVGSAAAPGLGRSSGLPFVLDLHDISPFHTRPLYGLLAITFGLSLATPWPCAANGWLMLQGFMQLALDLALVSLLGALHRRASTPCFPSCTSSSSSPPPTSWSVRGSLIGRHPQQRSSTPCSSWRSGRGSIQPVEFAGGLAPMRSMGYAVYQVVIHAVAFLAVAILSSHLAYRLRQTGQELERRGLDLRNLQTLHQAIVANISSGLMTFDLDGRVVSFNEAAERITGYRL